MNLNLLLTGALLLPGAAVSAQPDGPGALTLARARRLAREHSPDLAAQRHAVAAAQGRLRQAGAFPNPVIAYGREQTSSGELRTSQDILSLEQAVDVFGQRSARRAAAGARVGAATARLEAAEAQLDYEVARSYGAAAGGARRAMLADQAAEAFARAVRVSADRLAGGDVSGYQHRRLRLEAARYAGLRLQAAVARDSAVRALATLVGLEPGDLVLVDSLPPAPLSDSVDALVARAFAQRAELRAAALDVDAAAAGARLVAAARVPVPLLTLGYKAEDSGAGARLNGFVAGVSLAVPLWDRGGGALAASRSDAGRRSAELESLRRQTEREVRAAFGALRALEGELGALGAELGPEAARARRAADAAYTDGELTLVEWLDAVRAYFEAESSYVTLWSEYVARRAALERATGAPLF